MLIGLLFLALATMPLWLLWLFVRTRRQAMNERPEHPSPSGLKTIALYTLAGPALGALPWLLLFLMLSKNPPASWFSILSLVGIASTLAVAYLFGLVPALLSGLFYAWIEHIYWRRQQKKLPLRLAIPVSALGSQLACLLAVLLFSGFNRKHPLAGFAVIAVPGLLASMALAMLQALHNSHAQQKDPEFND